MLISAGSLIYVFRHFKPDELAREVRAMNWSWVAAAVLFDILVYFLQGWRWSLLLRPVADIPFMRSIRAIYVGLFANEVLPLRTGEVIRCFLQARWSELPFTVTLSSAIIERLFDGFWLVVCFVVTTRVVDLPEAYYWFGKILVAVLIAAGALLGGAMFARDQTREALEKNRVLSRLHVLIEDLHIIGHSRYLYLSAAASLPYLLLQVLPIYALLHGYGIPLSLGEAFAVTVILRFSSVIPQGPGNVGTFQLATVLALSLFGVDKELAARFSFVLWAVITMPLLIAGFIALAITGMRLSELRHEAQQAQ